jgi:hypothetical protein
VCAAAIADCFAHLTASEILANPIGTLPPCHRRRLANAIRRTRAS